MKHLNFIIVFFVSMALFRIIELILFEKNKTRGEVYAEWTFNILSINYGLLVLSTVLEYIVVKKQINLIITGVAIGIMIIRFLIKCWVFKSLGEHYSSRIEIRETHKLIRTGPYRYLRHPVYLSNLLEFIAVPLFANSFYTILWSFPVQFLLIHIRIHLEEKILGGKFGEEYIRYKRETGGLFPLMPFMKRRTVKP